MIWCWSENEKDHIMSNKMYSFVNFDHEGAEDFKTNFLGIINGFVEQDVTLTTLLVLHSQMGNKSYWNFLVGFCLWYMLPEKHAKGQLIVN